MRAWPVTRLVTDSNSALARFGHLSGQGATVWQPYSSGATSRTVSVNCQRWPARSSTPVGWRLKHPGAVGSSPLVPGLDVLNPNLHHMGHNALLRRLLLTPDVSHDHRPVLADAHLRAVTLADPGPPGEAKRRAQPRHRLPHVRVDKHRDNRGRRNGPVGFHVSLHSSLADLPMVTERPALPGSSTGWDSGATAAMACMTTGTRVTGDGKRPFGGPAQDLMA